jgi:NlpC/P60 family putative phage cell wall peptidase
VTRHTEKHIGALRAPETAREPEPVLPARRDSATPRLRVQPFESAERIVSIARSWIGTPYVHQASVKGAGCDCLGLLRGVWRELRGDEPEHVPPYSADWAEATGADTLYRALSRHLTEIPKTQAKPGDIALFRMPPHGPAKHSGILANRDGHPTLIHARQNKRVSEEVLSRYWRAKLAFAFQL